MSNNILNQKIITYDIQLYNNWESDLDFSWIPIIVPAHNQSAIKKKAERRSNRYFKETYVIKQMEKELSCGLYSHSRPWIYGDKWNVIKPRIKTAVEKELLDHLLNYCTKEKMTTIQKRAKEYIAGRDRESWPKEPDLFVVDKKKCPMFIEVKAIDEQIYDKQLTGLAFIKKYMGYPVWIIRLCEGTYDENRVSRRLKEDEERFLEKYRSLPE